MHQRRLMLTFCLFLATRTLVAQSFPQIQCGLEGTYLPVTNRQLAGVGIQLLYQPTPRFGTGIRVVATRVRIGETFTYVVQDPRLTLLQIGWFNQLTLFRARRVAIYATGQASVLSNQVGDWAGKQYTGRGGYVPKVVATDVYAMLEPGVRTMYALSNRLALSTAASHTFAFGTGTFSTPGQFTAPLLTIGVQVLATTRR